METAVVETQPTTPAVSAPPPESAQVVKKAPKTPAKPKAAPKARPAVPRGNSGQFTAAPKVSPAPAAPAVETQKPTPVETITGGLRRFLGLGEG